jgi:lambda family phage portal protein
MAIFGFGRINALKKQLFDAKTRNANLKRAYAAAQNNRLTSDWVRPSTSADSEVKGSIKTVRNSARELVRNSDFAKAALRAIRNNVVGTGIKNQAQVSMKRGDRLAEEINTRIEKEFKRWGNAKRCHVGGKLSWSEIQGLSITSMLESGEVFIRLVKQSFGDSRVPLGLEVIEADLLDDGYNAILKNGNQVRMGVEVNKWQRPVAYHFWDYHPGDYQFASVPKETKKRIRISADDIIHLYTMERPGQTRGMSAFASAIMRLRNLSGYEESEIVAARATASMMGFVKTPDQDMFEDGTYTQDSVLDFSPGSIRRLAPGEELQFFSPSRPDDSFTPFVQQMLRAVAAGVGCSYTQVSSDFSQSNYSSSRLEILETRAHYRTLQQYLIESLCQEVYSKWLEMAVMSGTLDLAGYDSDPERYEECKWIPPAAQFVDPQKEAAAYKDLIRSGVMTLSQVIALYGGDFDDQMRQRQRELELAKELGVVLDSDPSQVSEQGYMQSNPSEKSVDQSKDTNQDELD